MIKSTIERIRKRILEHRVAQRQHRCKHGNIYVISSPIHPSMGEWWTQKRTCEDCGYESHSILPGTLTKRTEMYVRDGKIIEENVI